jgi:hypothetical protein
VSAENAFSTQHSVLIMMQYTCCNDNRRDLVQAHPAMNGIDFLEVVDDPALPDAQRQRTLRVRFLKDAGLGALAPANVRIEGGERVRNVHAIGVAVDAADAHVLVIDVNEPGDFSTYTLRIVRSQSDMTPPDDFDRVLSSVEFSFKVECPSEFDCAQEMACPPEAEEGWDINYLARDYASFRRLMLDRMAALMPEWRERSPADMGVALVELLAYTADRLSYTQDAIATEAYLGTARRRVSVRRHARLVDYTMHDGCNARAWVQVRLDPDAAPEAALLLEPVDALGVRTRFLTRNPNPNKLPDAEFTRTLAAFQPEVFELMRPAALYREHNELRFYTWGDTACCLPKGATAATLIDDAERRLRLRPGDVLVFAERVNPLSGPPAVVLENGVERVPELRDLFEEADRAKRQAVRLTRVTPEAALLLENGHEIDRTPGPLRTDDLTSQAIVEIEWEPADALQFPLCVSAISDEEHGKKLVEDVSVALGNIVLVDHGRTIVDEPLGTMPKARLFYAPEASSQCASNELVAVPPRFRPALRERPLTNAAPDDPRLAASATLNVDAAAALPEIMLIGTRGATSAPWQPRRDLIGSGPDAREFVAETEADMTTRLRFGDDTHGQRPAEDTSFSATYRVGNGARGNVGAESIDHVVAGAVALGAIHSVRNPMAARGGSEPESIDDVRQRAPSAFRTQERAITAADYAAMAEQRGEVQRAAATFRWTGSWRTVFITADRAGGAAVDEPFETALRSYVEPFRMAGQDLEIDTPRPVSLEITMSVCVKPGYFRSDVKRVLVDVFSSRDLPDGRRGMFHPDNFTFGQPVYLSQLYAATQAVAGVSSVLITQFERMGQPDPRPLHDGKLVFARLEIPRCDSDPNFPERGIVRFEMQGGL